MKTTFSNNYFINGGLSRKDRTRSRALGGRLLDQFPRHAQSSEKPPGTVSGRIVSTLGPKGRGEGMLMEPGREVVLTRLLDRAVIFREKHSQPEVTL